jgi:hypothetical protein
MTRDTQGPRRPGTRASVPPTRIDPVARLRQARPQVAHRHRHRPRPLAHRVRLAGHHGGCAAVFVAALAVPLDDPALVVALMLTLRSGRVACTA